jgi:hypothetical protein
MRRLNGRVERKGDDYRDVAKRHLEELGLLPESPRATEPRGTVVLAVTPMSDLGYLPIRAAEAIREVMPARRLQVAQHEIPAEAVRDGSARFGLVGAEEFFDIGPDGTLARVPEIEAVGAVGSRLAHVIARESDPDPAQWQRIGTALDTPEAVDPLLPASPGLSPDTPPTKQRLTADIVSALMNAFAVVFLIMMVYLFFQPLPAVPALRATAAEDNAEG